MCNFKAAADEFKEAFELYRNAQGCIDGLKRSEAFSVETMLDLCTRLRKEFDKWDFDASGQGEPYKHGMAAPALKEYLTK